MTEDSFDHFMHGERYMKSPEQVKCFIRGLPITDIPAPYVVFKPLSEIDEKAAGQDFNLAIICEENVQLSQYG